jgi:hypothetical protein
VAFDSDLFDYRVRHPVTWAEFDSDAPERPDRIAGLGYTWKGISHSVTPGTSLSRYIKAHPLQRLDDGLCIVERGGMRVARPPVGSLDWKPTRIDGRRALRRSVCGFVDAVVIVDDRAFTFTLERDSVKGDPKLFATIAATIELPRQFESDVHDYRIALRPAWQARPAADAGDADRFDGPASLELRIGTRPYPGGEPVEWAEKHLPRHAVDPGGRTGCWWNGGGIIWTGVTDEHFKSAVVAGHDAAIRSACGFIDAAIDVGDRIYVLTMESPRHMPGGDGAAFDALIQRLALPRR